MSELSNLLVVFQPRQKDNLIEKINQIKEAEIFHEDDIRHQMIVVLEVESTQAQVNRFDELQHLDGIVSIKLLNHVQRTSIKASLAASAALSVGIELSDSEFEAAKTIENGVTWHKGICEFCNRACPLMVGVKNARVVIVKGCEKEPEHQDLNCIKGYLNAKLMHFSF